MDYTDGWVYNANVGALIFDAGSYLGADWPPLPPTTLRPDGTPVIIKPQGVTT